MIRTESDYESALQRMEVIFDAPKGSKMAEEAEVLAILLEAYESEHYPIEYPDPIRAIQIRMNELNLKQKDLVGLIGGKSRVSEVLNRRKRLTIEMVRSLSTLLDLPTELLVQEYPLDNGNRGSTTSKKPRSKRKTVV